MSFADLTWDDVTKTVFPAFTASVKALQTGKVDAVGAVPSGPGVYELAASKTVSYTHLPLPTILLV